MKLNPEDIEVVSFETQTDIVQQPNTDPNDPTPNSYCFVCD